MPKDANFPIFLIVFSTPFVTIPSLGEAVAKSIVEARETRPFSSKKDVERRTSINKTQFAKLQLLGVFDELPDDDETTLF